MDMTPMTDFDETTMINFHNYNAFTRMSAQTAIQDNATDRYVVNKHKEQRRTKPWSALRPCPSTGSSAASQSPSVPIPAPNSRPPHLFSSLQNQIVDHFL